MALGEESFDQSKGREVAVGAVHEHDGEPWPERRVAKLVPSGEVIVSSGIALFALIAVPAGRCRGWWRRSRGPGFDPR
jgi:hypothetical protein